MDLAGHWEPWQLLPALLLPCSPAQASATGLWLLGPKQHCGVKVPEQFGQCILSWLHSTVLCPTHAKRMKFLMPGLSKLLQDVDPEVLRMTLQLLLKVREDTTSPIASSIGLQLVERLLPLFNHIRLGDAPPRALGAARKLRALWTSRPPPTWAWSSR